MMKNCGNQSIWCWIKSKPCAFVKLCLKLVIVSVATVSFVSCSSSQEPTTFNVSASAITLTPGGKPVALSVTLASGRIGGAVSLIISNASQRGELTITIPDSAKAACSNLVAGNTCIFQISASSNTSSASTPVRAIIKVANALPTEGKTVDIHFEDPSLTINTPTITDTSAHDGSIVNNGNATIYLGQLSIETASTCHSADPWRIVEDNCSNTVLLPKTTCHFSLSTGIFTKGILNVPLLGANNAVIKTITKIVLPDISSTAIDVTFPFDKRILIPGEDPIKIAFDNNSPFCIPATSINASFDKQIFTDNSTVAGSCFEDGAAVGQSCEIELSANDSISEEVQGLSDNFLVELLNSQVLGSRLYTLLDPSRALSTLTTDLYFSPNSAPASGGQVVLVNEVSTLPIVQPRIMLKDSNDDSELTANYQVLCDGESATPAPEGTTYICPNNIPANGSMSITVYGGASTATPNVGLYNLNVVGTVAGNDTNTLIIPTEVMYPDLDFDLPTISDTSAQPVTLTNTTQVPAKINSIGLTNTSFWSISNNQCTSLTDDILQPGESCTFDVQNNGRYINTVITVNGDWFESPETTELLPEFPTFSVVPTGGVTLSNNDNDTFTLTNESAFTIPAITAAFDNSSFGQNSSVQIALLNCANIAPGGQCFVDVSAGTIANSDLGTSAFLQFRLDGSLITQRQVTLDNVITAQADPTQRTGAYEKLRLTYTGSSGGSATISNIDLSGVGQYLEIAAPFGISPDTCTGTTLNTMVPTCTVWLHALKQNAPTSDTHTITVDYSPSTGEADSIPVNVKTTTYLYAGGNFSFTTAGGSVANRVAAFDGSAWQALGLGISSRRVYTMTVGKYGNLYIGGNFTRLGRAGPNSALRVAVWDGLIWRALNDGMSAMNEGFLNGTVFASAVNGEGDIYFGGSFTRFESGSTAFRIAKWNRSFWTTPGNIGFSNGAVRAIAAYGNDSIYVGGNFRRFSSPVDSSRSVYRVAHFSGGVWNRLGTTLFNGVNSTVRAIAVDENDNNAAYIAGDFIFTGGSILPFFRIAKWDDINGNGNGAWSRLPPALVNGTSNRIRAVAVGSDGSVYVGGQFLSASLVPGTRRIAKWNGTAWESLNGGITTGNAVVNALTIDVNNDVYAAGNITSIGGVTVSRVAKWSNSGSAWSRLGTATFNRQVFALAMGAVIEIQ
ncbi:MAG: hypothetical protein AAGA27_04975 [Pseudomonadota bacterium]